MSTICAGRVQFLEKEIVKAIRITKAVSHLTDNAVNSIFGDLIKDPIIKQKLEHAHSDKH